MMILAIISLLVGMVLGQRFKVLILGPAILLAFLTVISIGIARGDSAWTVVLTTIMVNVGLQTGYLLGISIRRSLASAHASKQRTETLANTLRPQRPAL